MIMNKVLSSFLLLLRNALWGSHEPLREPLTQAEWKSLFILAREQTVEGIVMDAVGALPPQQKPPMDIRLQAIGRVQQIEEGNALLNRELLAMLVLIEKRRLRVVLMKGQGAASRYLSPMHRCPGDIDLFAPDDFEAVNALMMELSAELGKVTPEKHTDYMLREVAWEIHNHMSDMCHAGARRFISAGYPRETAFVEIEGRLVPVFPPSFDAVYMVAHMVHHVVSEGLGLRQLCDWVMLLHKEKDEIEREELVRYVVALHLERPFKVLGVIAVELLGLPREELPLTYGEKERKIARLLWSDILKQGNFGKYSGRVPAAGLWGRLGNYFYTLERCVRLYGVCPSEASRRPFMKIIRFFQRGMD